MKKKILIILGIIIIIGTICYFWIKNNIQETVNKVSEYVPEEEVSDENLRKTIVTLYFVNSNNNLETEARLIDSKELLREPYKVLVGMLIEGPKNTSLETVINEETKVLGTKLNGNCVTINLSKEFIELDNMDVANVSNIIFSIVNTLTELKEVTSVKFLIDGEESDAFSNLGINLKSEFVRK